MNKLLCAAVAAMLLSGCDKPAPTAPAAEQAPAPAAPATTESTQAPATTEPEPSPAPAQTATAPAADPAADKAVDDAIDNALSDHARYRAVFDELQRAVAAKDAAAVAALVDYPLAATVDGKKTKIEDAPAFVAEYEKIVTPAIADAVVKQKYSDLFVNYKGVMIGNGQVWLNGVCKDRACKQAEVKVVAIQPGA